MTPRTVVFSLEEKLTVAQVWADHPEIRFSRIPVYSNNTDHVVGFVLKSDLLLCIAEGRDQTLLADLKRPIAVVLDSARLTEIFDRLIAQQNQVAMVVDEYGGVEGLAKTDPAPDMRELARRKWVQRAKRMGLDADKERKDDDATE